MFSAGISPAYPYADNDRTGVGRKKRAASTVGEKRLSSKARTYLDQLRDRFSDYDIFAADDDDDRAGLLSSSDKEFAVLFSSEELEKMAEDIKYADGKLTKLQSIVAMSTRICEENGFVLENGDRPAAKNGGFIRSLAFSVAGDGTMEFSVGLEDLSGRKSVISASTEAEFVRKLQELKKS